MQKIFPLLLFLLCLVMNVGAQGTAVFERSDFTFKLTKMTNSSGEVDRVTLSA